MAAKTIMSIQVNSSGKKELVVKHISEDGTPVKVHEADSRRILDAVTDGDSDDIYIDRIPEAGPLPTSPAKNQTPAQTQQKKAVAK